MTGIHIIDAKGRQTTNAPTEIAQVWETIAQAQHSARGDGDDDGSGKKKNQTAGNQVANQGRPSFSDLLKNYPTGDVPSTYALVGGGLLRSYNQDQVSYANICAMRLSYALNKFGAPIPYERGKTFKGADNLNYFIRVKDMAS